ncbi:MAG TPA: sigma-70 family RNA polymerase sigma factor [Candidatus Limnocylindrales bacterium]|nr:sigma-70 family RNA polymerase sigma factor [Candidatus Limnocylindrales bacterium]
MPDDGALVGRIASGDEVAFELAYDRHGGLVFGSLVRFLGDREAAAEVAQDAFLALWRRAGRYDASVGSLGGWLLAIARHRAIDRMRGEARRPSPAPVELLDAAHDGDPERDPAGLADRRWSDSVVRTMVSALPDAERRVVALAYSDGLSQSEIADRLGVPIGTVKSRTRRALARLRAQLAGVPELVGEEIRIR